MNAADIFARLRSEIEKSDLYLSQIARKAEVNYHRLYRFWNNEAELTIDDANKLYITLTGKSFIAVPDNDL